MSSQKNREKNKAKEEARIAAHAAVVAENVRLRATLAAYKAELDRVRRERALGGVGAAGGPPSAAHGPSARATDPDPVVPGASSGDPDVPLDELLAGDFGPHLPWLDESS